MSVFLWILQAVLAALFVLSGLSKLIQAKEQLAKKYVWMNDVSQGTVRLIGLLEVLGAIGLVLPAAVGVATVLTPLAATGLAILLVLAAAWHLRRQEPSGVVVTLTLIVPVALVVWGRFGPYSF